MKIINSDMAGSNYSIHIGQDILGTVGKLAISEGLGRKIIIISNPDIFKLYGSKLVAGLDSENLEHYVINVPEGEESKSFSQTRELYEKLVEFNADRDTCIIALGGGVIGDLAGFVAATYMRGIPIIQVPTTLLAQVDSAIGGKTAVDLPQGKNLVGAFHQPALVVSDISCLKTLPEEDFISGMAEVIKYGIISDPDLFSFLEKKSAEVLNKNIPDLQKIVEICSNIKTKVVRKDEKDCGIRMNLNLGHTFGHALETATDYTGYSHGEAIAIGMVFAIRLAIKNGLAESDLLERAIAILNTYKLPIKIDENLDSQQLLKIMKHDKKAAEGKIRFVLPTGIGHVKIVDDIPEEIIIQTMEEMFK